MRLLAVLSAVACLSFLLQPVPTYAESHNAIRGTVHVRPELWEALRGLRGGGVLFIMAKQGEGGPPLAVLRVPSPHFPFPYELSQANVMVPGRMLEGEVEVSARLDGDGNIGPVESGDMEGAYRWNPAKPGDQQVDIVIDRMQ